MKTDVTRLALRPAVLAATEILDRAGVENAKRDAGLILAHVFKDDIGILYREPDRCLSATEKAEFDALVARRACREPLSHLTGHREFWSLDFLVTSDVLDPRPDSETLIEAVLKLRAQGFQPQRILDLGTGSGCLLLALLSEFPDASGIGVDASEPALAVARRNAERLQLANRAGFRLGNWGDGVMEQFDLVISNPPYIPSADKSMLQPEVSEFEPHSALFGGEDGLDCYREILAQIHILLRPGGLLVLEVGIEQAPLVGELVVNAGFVAPEYHKDIAGIERCVMARLGK